MRFIPEIASYRFQAAAALALSWLVSGCAGEHLFRAQDRKIEELRLERARQDEALGRAREAIDQLRDEWKSYAARESASGKDSVALQGAFRKLAQRLEEVDGKRAKLEERVHLAETRAVELNQAFTQVSSMLKAAEGDLIALRSLRASGGFPSNGVSTASAATASAREPSSRTPADAGKGPDDGQQATAATSIIDSIVAGRGSLGLVYGAVLLAAGVLVALVCVYIGARLRPTVSGRTEREKEPEKAAAKASAAPEKDKEKEKAPAAPAEIEASHSAAAPEPSAQPAARVPAAPARLVFPADGVNDFFEAAENASARFATSTNASPPRSQTPTEHIEQETQTFEEVTSDELSNTDVLPVPGELVAEEPETVVVSLHRGPRKTVSASSEIGAQTEVLSDEDAPGRTQVISDAEEASDAPRGGKAPSTRELLAGKQAPRTAASALQKKTRAPDEKDLLDELENIIGYKMGEKSG